MSFLKTKTKESSTVNYNATLDLEKITPRWFLYENKTQESANENERRKYCLTPGKLSLKEDGRVFPFSMQSFLLPVALPLSSRLLRPNARISEEAVGSTQALVSMSSHRLVLVSQLISTSRNDPGLYS